MGMTSNTQALTTFTIINGAVSAAVSVYLGSKLKDKPNVETWAPIVFGLLGGLLTFGMGMMVAKYAHSEEEAAKIKAGKLMKLQNR